MSRRSATKRLVPTFKSTGLFLAHTKTRKALPGCLENEEDRDHICGDGQVNVALRRRCGTICDQLRKHVIQPLPTRKQYFLTPSEISFRTTKKKSLGTGGR